jgi:hypothetical protein
VLYVARQTRCARKPRPKLCQQRKRARLTPPFAMESSRDYHRQPIQKTSHADDDIREWAKLFTIPLEDARKFLQSEREDQ